MKNLFIGIDPSINSTGVCCMVTDKNFITESVNYYIIKNSKLTKKEQAAQDAYMFFDYITYPKLETKDSENNHEFELKKTHNLYNIVLHIKDIYSKFLHKHPMGYANIYITIEGISYGSTIRTKSVFDLAGLNYMIRSAFIKDAEKGECTLVVGTPGELKKFATGKGNANKELILECFDKIHYGKDMSLIPKKDDIADAYFMACFGKNLCKLEQ